MVLHHPAGPQYIRIGKVGVHGVWIGEVAGAKQDVPLVPFLGLDRQLPPLPLLKYFFDSLSLSLETRLTSSFQVLSLRSTSFSPNPLQDPASPGTKINSQTKETKTNSQKVEIKSVVFVSIDITAVYDTNRHLTPNSFQPFYNLQNSSLSRATHLPGGR